MGEGGGVKGRLRARQESRGGRKRVAQATLALCGKSWQGEREEEEKADEESNKKRIAKEWVERRGERVRRRSRGRKETREREQEARARPREDEEKKRWNTLASIQIYIHTYTQTPTQHPGRASSPRKGEERAEAR